MTLTTQQSCVSFDEAQDVDILVLFIDTKKAFQHRATKKELRKRLEVAQRR